MLEIRRVVRIKSIAPDIIIIGGIDGKSKRGL